MRKDYDSEETNTNQSSAVILTGVSQEVPGPDRKMRVYIASPYTLGDVAVNVKKQIDVADKLMNSGFAPFWPLHSHFQHLVHPRPYQDWIDIDLEWVLVCDVVLRLPGESKGADGEVAYAKQNGIPVVYSVAEAEQFRANIQYTGDKS